MSMDSLEGLDIGLKALTLRGNKLENLPDLNLLKGLEVVDLQDNPLLCDCPLLPLRKLVPFCLNFVSKIFRRITQWNNFPLAVSCRWVESVGLEVMATCGSPPEVKGLKIREVHVFKSCQEGKSHEPEATRPPKLNTRKLTPKRFGSKEKQMKPKLKKLHTTKRRPQTKPKETKKKKKTL